MFFVPSIQLENLRKKDETNIRALLNIESRLEELTSINANNSNVIMSYKCRFEQTETLINDLKSQLGLLSV